MYMIYSYITSQQLLLKQNFIIKPYKAVPKHALYIYVHVYVHVYMYVHVYVYVQCMLWYWMCVNVACQVTILLIPLS